MTYVKLPPPKNFFLILIDFIKALLALIGVIILGLIHLFIYWWDRLIVELKK